MTNATMNGVDQSALAHEKAQDLDLQLKALPSLTEKFVVDFANGLEVVNDHLRVKKDRVGFSSRLYDHFTGAAHRRDLEIERTLAQGVNASLEWLTDLTAEHARTNLALVRVSDRLCRLRVDVNQIAHFAADTAERLEHLAVTVKGRCDQIEVEVHRIDQEQRAEAHMNRIMSKWEAGDYSRFARLQRLYAALDDLYWGDFGNFLRSQRGSRRQREMVEHLGYQCQLRLRADADGLAAPEDSFALSDWLMQPASALPMDSEALAYLGNWSKATVPFSYAATQPMVESPLMLPLLFDTRRAASAMSTELFEERLI